MRQRAGAERGVSLSLKNCLLMGERIMAVEQKQFGVEDVLGLGI